MEKQIEGKTEFFTHIQNRVSKDMPVFYNPVMKLNRDLSLLVLATLTDRDLRVCFAMEASGVRVARFLNEIVNEGIVTPIEIRANDLDMNAVKLMRKNISLNQGKFPAKSILITEKEASLLLKEQAGWNYIDIDPFGSPNPFLDSAVRRTSRNGILAVTATDTSALAGTYPHVCRRKYWAEPSRTWLMHEIGLRILARKVQLIAAQYEKSLVPILSVSTDHYYRIFFRCSKENVKKVLSKHEYVEIIQDTQSCRISKTNHSDTGNIAGPLWTGPLHDKKFVDKLIQLSEQLGEQFEEASHLLSVIREECEVDAIGFVDVHHISKLTKIHGFKRDELISALGKNASKTHVRPTGIKTTHDFKEIVKILKKLT